MDVFGQMHLFVKVVESSGFTSAARELGVPKSTVSRQVAHLEDRLGVRLLHRTTRALRPTEAGQAYYERCVRILTDLVEAESAVTRAQVIPRGTLRISAPLTFGYLFLGDLVAAFLLEYPEVQLEMSLSDRKVDLIEDGFDLAIRVGVLDDSSLVARRIGTATQVIAGSPAYFARRGTPQLPTDLAHHDCMIYDGGARATSWRFADDQTVTVKGPLVSNNGDILRAAAVAGLGLVYTPRFIIGSQLRSGSLVPVLDEHMAPPHGIWAIYPANRHLSAKVRSFVDFAVGWIGEVPPWDRCPE
ncbi:MAG: LysR substrate-binding domain-containing protein [Myxococcota bacterium]